MIITEKQLFENVNVRKISTKRKRKLQRLGVICWWSPYAQSWVWDENDMASPSHLRQGKMKHKASLSDRGKCRNE